jgi:hypothetical protein
MGGRSRLRSLHCPPTDPVSFALADGAPTAAFPRLRGWSISDTARRAVAEHGAWLEAGNAGGERAGSVLGRLITAARAALVWESVEQRAPEIPLTAGATLASLAARLGAADGIAEAARESYRDFALNWHAPAADVIAGLAATVRELPAYSISRAALAA